MKKVLAYVFGSIIFLACTMVMMFLFDRAYQIESKAKQPDPIQVIRIEESLKEV